MTADLRQLGVKPSALVATCLDNGLKFITRSVENQQSESFPAPGTERRLRAGFHPRDCRRSSGRWPPAIWESTSQDQAGSAGQAIKISRASELQRCSFWAFEGQSNGYRQVQARNTAGAVRSSWAN